ncbi:MULTISPECIES: basic amino acid ABC transporter substrate-binding protein [Fusobacterium]|uniref:basic amino acid ABC transporter substrate-binding protein n=1 Tax=Fusobacterium TaxID=848 RepID=UPI0025B8FA3E|nr:basic amino acid ABC transporter substrate-binding protein [Fusobacterium sp.]MCI7223587.1 basic amino acid ABC transporter substrate-binding protein [Fusobacterium sp.]MDD7411419.1 basic amino acid ABC transporter substrate-binding protein [Fusobacteriaceae bacterium]MDY5713773.1 basic amino acid ABC transporter substrate-binding protein [Fusobacterium gastrosuis]
MKKIVKLLSVLAVSLFVSISVFAKQVVYVGTNAEFAPFEYLEKNQIVGFDIDLLNAISKETGIEFKVKDMAFDGLLPALQTKKVDLVIAGMTATPERQKTVLFSKPYFTAKQVIITKGEDKSLKSFDNLAGKKVGVMLGFTGDSVVSEIKGAKVERFNAAYAAIMALNQGKVDAVVLDSEPAKKYIANSKQLMIANVPAEEEDYAIAVRKNDKALIEKIDAAVAKIRANGEYDKILKKYF